MRKIALLALLAAFALSPLPSSANDSEAEWALGGLTLKPNADISMDSEDLFISTEQVRVDYIYTNHSDQDREVVIAFPLPAQPDPEYYYEYHSYPLWDDLDFQTKVNGAPVEYEITDRAMLGGRDITEQILAEGWPIYWFRDNYFYFRDEKMSEAEKRRMVDLGLFTLRNEGVYLDVEPAWQAQRYIMRKQIFPAGAQTRVSHQYTPLAGGSVGGMLYPGARKDSPEGLDEYRKQWCVDDSFLAGVDRKLAKGTEDRPVYYGETWLGYVLSSGANWRGPIKNFRLVVDKGSPDNLVSFCMNGVKKIAPTRFEVTKQDFEPEKDLNILILQFYSPED